MPLQETKGAALGLEGRLCAGKNVTVDCWTQKTVKQQFGPSSKFYNYLSRLHGLNGGSCIFDAAADVQAIGGIGDTRGKVLKGYLKIYTAGQLAGLSVEDVAQLQAQLCEAGVTGINLATEVKRAVAFLDSRGQPDYENANARTLTDTDRSQVQHLEVLADEEFEYEEE